MHVYGSLKAPSTNSSDQIIKKSVGQNTSTKRSAGQNTSTSADLDSNFNSSTKRNVIDFASIPEIDSSII